MLSSLKEGDVLSFIFHWTFSAARLISSGDNFLLFSIRLLRFVRPCSCSSGRFPHCHPQRHPVPQHRQHRGLQHRRRTRRAEKRTGERCLAAPERLGFQSANSLGGVVCLPVKWPVCTGGRAVFQAKNVGSKGCQHQRFQGDHAIEQKGKPFGHCKHFRDGLCFVTAVPYVAVIETWQISSVCMG